MASGSSVPVWRALGGAVVVEVQRRHGVDGQPLEQAVAQEARRLVQGQCAIFRAADVHREVDLRMRIVGRNLDAVDRDHAHPRVLEVADEFGHVALDLVGHAEAAVDGGFLVSHGRA